MHIVIKFWEPGHGRQLEEEFTDALQFSCLNEVVTVTCNAGVRHTYQMATVVGLSVQGGNHAAAH